MTTLNPAFTKVDPSSIESCDPLKTLWSVVDEDGKRVAYLASSVKTLTSPSTGKSRQVTFWGIAINADEFRSGIQFHYNSRAEAFSQIGRFISL